MLTEEERRTIEAASAQGKSLSDLPPELAEKMNEMLVSGVPPIQEETSAPTAQNPEQNPPEPETEKKAEEGKPSAQEKPRRRKALSLEEARQLALERGDTINQLRQKGENLQRRLLTDPAFRMQWIKENGGVAETFAPSPTPKNQDVDVWNDDFQRRQSEELSKLRREVDQMTQQKALRGYYRQLESFMAKNEDFAFQADLEELDSAVKAFASANGKSPESKDLEALGFDREDAEKFLLLCEVNQKQENEKYPTFSGAWADYRLEHPEKFRKQVDPQPKAQEQVSDLEKRREAMARIMGMPKVQRGNAAASPDNGMTREESLRWLNKHKNDDPANFSKADRETWQKVQRLLGL